MNNFIKRYKKKLKEKDQKIRPEEFSFYLPSKKRFLKILFVSFMIFFGLYAFLPLLAGLIYL